MAIPEKARRPEWLRIRLRTTEEFTEVRRMMDGLSLTTVCEEARCPNIFECWSYRTATFMILGDVCTRQCGFCAVTSGLPRMLPDPGEPRRVAEAVRQLGLAHAVVTSVDRDDLPDGGARHFARVIESVRELNDACSVEVLTPDFKGVPDALSIVLAAGPEVFSHNMETVARLYRKARPGSRYESSLELLRAAAEARDRSAAVGPRDRAGASDMRDRPGAGGAGERSGVADTRERAVATTHGNGGAMGPGAPSRPDSPGDRVEATALDRGCHEGGAPHSRERETHRFRVKTGLMAGLGETNDELRATFRDIRSAGVEVVTIGQYLQPTKEHLPVDRFVTPEEFASLKEFGLSLGFLHVEAGPLVRSSYRAHTHRPDPRPLHHA